MRLQMRDKVFENRLFDRFTFCRGLDHQISLAQISQPFGGANAGHGGGFVICGNLATGDLTVDVAINQGDGGGQAFGFDVRQQHIEPGEGKDMGNTAAHLACAYDAY